MKDSGQTSKRGLSRLLMSMVSWDTLPRRGSEAERSLRISGRGSRRFESTKP